MRVAAIPHPLHPLHTEGDHVLLGLGLLGGDRVMSHVVQTVIAGTILSGIIVGCVYVIDKMIDYLVLRDKRKKDVKSHEVRRNKVRRD